MASCLLPCLVNVNELRWEINIKKTESISLQENSFILNAVNLSHLTDNRKDLTGSKQSVLCMLWHLDQVITLKCFNIRRPKTINFPFVPNGTLMIFRCPSI